MKLVAYARTSDTNGHQDSIEAQVEACRAWVADNGHEVVAVFADDGVSGTTDLADRDGLAAAVAAVEGETAEGLIVHRLDRIARALHVQEAVLATVWTAKGCVYEAVSGEVPEDDETDPMRRFVRQVRGAVAELERGMVVARLQGGKRRAAARGDYIGGARLHRKYGYDLVDGKYVPREDEQAVIRRMRELREPPSGRTFRAIAQTLADEGHPPPSGEAWHPSAIMRILKREQAP
jgi:DNA invertase Pin-like site-specific DNA recombinase